MNKLTRIILENKLSSVFTARDLKRLELNDNVRYCQMKRAMESGDIIRLQRVSILKFRMVLLFFFLIILTISSCTKYETSDEIEIPFSLENNRIVLDATVNGKKGRFLFDTGATISHVDVNVKNLRYHGYVLEKGKKVKIYNLNRITLGEVELKTHSWIQFPSDYENGILQEEGFDGLLAFRIFEGYWCELSFSKNKIILHKEKPDTFTQYSPVLIENKYNDQNYIPITIDNNDFYFLIDTGIRLSMRFPDGLVRFKEQNEYLGILSDAEEGDHHLVQTNSIHIFDETYNDVSVITNSFLAKRNVRIFSHDYNDMGMLGINFLKYYDFLFDLRNLRRGKTTCLYYKPNTPLNERNYGFFSPMKEAPEFGVTDINITDSGITILSLIKDSVAYGKFNFRPGTLITKINGSSIKDLSMDEVIDPSFYLTITDYTILENGDEITIKSPLRKE